MWKKKFFYVLNYLKTVKAVEKKTIDGCTYRNKIKKPCWWQLPISKSPLSSGRRDNNCLSFSFVYQNKCFQYKTEKENNTIEFCLFELV